MNSDVIIPTMGIVLPLLGGGAGYLIRHIIEKRKELQNEVTKERRELYQQFIDLVIDIFGSSKIGRENSEMDLIQKLYTFYKKYVLYASPDVINSFSDYFQFLYANEDNSDLNKLKNHFRKLTKIMYDMRVDLGLSNRHLGKNGEKLFRALISDYDKIMTS